MAARDDRLDRVEAADAAPGIEVVGEAEDGAQAVELAARRAPDVVLMDIRMQAVIFAYESGLVRVRDD